MKPHPDNRKQSVAIGPARDGITTSVPYSFVYHIPVPAPKSAEPGDSEGVSL